MGTRTESAAVRALSVRRPERGRTIHYDERVIVLHLLDHLLELILSILSGDQLDFCPDKIFICRNEIQPINLRFQDDSLERLAEHQGVIKRAPGRILRKANSRGRVALGIAIDQSGFAVRIEPERQTRLIAVVVLPTPPFWLAIAMTRPKVTPPGGEIYHIKTKICKLFHVEQNCRVYESSSTR